MGSEISYCFPPVFIRHFLYRQTDFSTSFTKYINRGICWKNINCRDRLIEENYKYFHWRRFLPFIFSNKIFENSFYLSEAKVKIYLFYFPSYDISSLNSYWCRIFWTTTHLLLVTGYNIGSGMWNHTTICATYPKTKLNSSLSLFSI